MGLQPDKINLQFRHATLEDLPEIVRMLADDPLGSGREAYSETLSQVYYQAFDEIQADTNNELMVVEADSRVIGVLQITYIPSLTFQGGRRAQIEGVRIARDWRGRGIGKQAFEWAIQRARQRGCRIVQLTTNKQRPEALEFYLKLGFVNSHEGLKLYLDEHRKE
jgi:GNAT superfamily N-acetyltransferase